jgi:hypothetical protein
LDAYDEDTMTQAQSAEYGYRHVTTRVLMDDMAFGEQAPRPGHRLPGFDLPLAQGGRVRSDVGSGVVPAAAAGMAHSCRCCDHRRRGGGAQRAPEITARELAWGGIETSTSIHEKADHDPT